MATFSLQNLIGAGSMQTLRDTSQFVKQLQSGGLNQMAGGMGGGLSNMYSSPFYGLMGAMGTQTHGATGMYDLYGGNNLNQVVAGMAGGLSNMYTSPYYGLMGAMGTQTHGATGMYDLYGGNNLNQVVAGMASNSANMYNPNRFGQSSIYDGYPSSQTGGCANQGNIIGMIQEVLGRIVQLIASDPYMY